MQSNNADDMDRFMQAIAAFTASPETVTDLGRRLSPTDEGCFRSILTEITETVLRRWLVFRARPGVRVTLDVAERRVHRIIDVEGAFADRFRSVLGRGLMEEDVQDVRRLLEAFCDGQDTLYIVPHLPENTDIDTLGGLSVRDLLAPVEKPPASTSLPAALADAMDAVSRRAQAVVVMSGTQCVIRSGDGKMCDALLCIHEGQEDTLMPSPMVEVWCNGLIQDGCLIAAQSTPYHIVMFVAEDQLAECFTLIRAAVLAL